MIIRQPSRAGQAKTQSAQDDATKEFEELATLKAKGVLKDAELTTKKKQFRGL